MRIVIDMQGAQTESRFRGIGRYTLSLVHAIIRNCREQEIILALSGLFPHTIEPLRAAFESALPQENIRVWYAPGPVMECEPGNALRREVAELIREAFFASLQPDVVYIPSFIEGYVDNAVTSIGRFDRLTPVCVTMYDLIPLLSSDQYLKSNPSYARYYQRKISNLRDASFFVAISESSRQECLSCLPVSEASIVNISAAIDPHFRILSIQKEQAEVMLTAFGIARPFVLYTGGADDRKNLPRLIQAFASLPGPVRAGHQLVFAGKMSMESTAALSSLARSSGLRSDDLCFTGYVTDEELVKLYNLSKLFVFPSWHEGFGLPALEAMACGVAVIGANTSSLPEVIGLEEALFDPFDVSSLAAKMTQALTDESFRATLRTHGLEQAKRFSWDESAQRAIAGFESLADIRKERTVNTGPQGKKPRLAFVSPLPPEHTGIADYSAELLPALSEFYDIELVTAQPYVDDPWCNGHGKVRDVAWLRSHAHELDRVLYQMGNSVFHYHMVRLLQEIPGTVVLHDFYLSGLMAWAELHKGGGASWSEALFLAHGYDAVRERYLDPEMAKQKYPVNLHVLQHAKGVIVHSEYSKKLMRHWYAGNAGSDWQVIPLLRSPAGASDKARARKELGIDQEDFVVCSFGFIDPTKLNHRLLNAWLASGLAGEHRCRLIFVGGNHGGDYGRDLVQTIRASGHKDRIQITGFAPSEQFRLYLDAADMAVQLRTNSRGETSAAALDCMNHSLALIVNANGSMAELHPDAVWMLPDEFDDAVLVEALETLWREPQRRFVMGEKAREIILNHHAPAACAQRYMETIERFHCQATTVTPALIQAIATQNHGIADDTELIALANCLSATFPLPRPAKRLFLDVTATCRKDLKTGIERVARALLLALLENPPPSYRVEPVYLSDAGDQWHYRSARRYTLGLLGCPPEILDDEIVELENGDVLLGLDLSGASLVQADHAGLFQHYRNRGVSVYSVVFDLLPVDMPEVFPPGADRVHAQWLQTVSKFDGAFCISKAVAESLAAWQVHADAERAKRLRPFRIGWFHLGADLDRTAPSQGLPGDAEKILRHLPGRPTFLMVGTLEPRKGYLQVLQAFSRLWNEGHDVNLVIVGHEGWQDLPDKMRRDLPKTIGSLQTHPQWNNRLFWLKGISDEYLDKVYAASACLIAASEGEGFGLPLIEAAQHKLPIIARDIPVFREVAGEHAFYFTGKESDALAQAIMQWLALYEKGCAPASDAIHWLTWKESAAELLDVLFHGQADQGRFHQGLDVDGLANERIGTRSCEHVMYLILEE